MTNFKDASVGLLVAEQPLRASVFDQFGIDYCCAGKQTLVAACEQSGIALDTVLARLVEHDGEHLLRSGTASLLTASLTELSNHIEQTHHVYLKVELPRLQALADRVAKVHGIREPDLLKVQHILAIMSREILEHTAHEENIFFPLFRRLEASLGKVAVCPTDLKLALECLDSEHQQAGAALMQLRQLTNQYTAPETACASWQALLVGLAELDQDLRLHIHKENSILFPLALKTVAAATSKKGRKNMAITITEETTVKDILDAYPDAISVFENHGVSVPTQCDESILDTELGICDGMCHIDDLAALVHDLQLFVDTKAGV